MRCLEGFVVSCLVVLSAAADLGASPAWQQSPMPPQRAGREVQDLIDAYVISKMQDALQIDDEQFAKMVVAQKKLQQHRRDYQRKRRAILRELQTMVRGSESPEDEVAARLERLEELKSEFEATSRKDYRKIDEILTVHQRARYRLLEVMLERRMQELLQEVRGRQRNPDRRRPNR